MKKHVSTILILLIFLTGLSVLLYPTVSNYVNSKSQSKAIASYVESMDKIDTSEYDAIIAQAKEYNQKIQSDSARFAIKGEALQEYLHLLGSDGGAVGYMEIGSIGVTLPIYLGDSPEVLQVGAGTMPGSSLPIGGPGTHAVITGHRGLPSSRLFTDLDKVAEGDIFVLYVLDETLTYQVDQIRIVEPQDLTELAIQPDKDLCTLVTCTPYGINTHRMLVRGHRIDNIETEQEIHYHVTADAIQVDTLLVAPILALPLLLIVLLIVFLSANSQNEKQGSKKHKYKGKNAERKYKKEDSLQNTKPKGEGL